MLSMYINALKRLALFLDLEQCKRGLSSCTEFFRLFVMKNVRHAHGHQ